MNTEGMVLTSRPECSRKARDIIMGCAHPSFRMTERLRQWGYAKKRLVLGAHKNNFNIGLSKTKQKKWNFY